MNEEGRAFYFFLGTLFFLMGVRLVLDARSEAAAVASWNGGGAPAGRLAFLYSLAGTAFCLCGAALIGELLWAPKALAARFMPPSLDAKARMAVGAFLALSGLGMAASRFTRAAASALPAALEADGLLDQPKPLRRLLSSLVGWLIAADLAVYGLSLFSR